MYGEEASILRFGVFLSGLLALAVLEARWPQRPRALPRGRRWFTNLLMPTLGALLTVPMAAIGPLTAVAASYWAERAGVGLFHWLVLPPAMELMISVALLDLAIYWQHRAFHRVGWLWRLHRVHHADPELDVTTGVRFHPIEYGLSMLWKAAVVLLTGASFSAVIVFEILLNLLSLFNHANLRLPVQLDRKLRRVIVTPDFHAVHHSRRSEEHHRNFGFNLAWWDYLFGSYRPTARAGPQGLAIGLDAVPADRAVGPMVALLLPAAPPPAGE